jgi:hypothetical protein
LLELELVLELVLVLVLQQAPAPDPANRSSTEHSQLSRYPCRLLRPG